MASMPSHQYHPNNNSELAATPASPTLSRTSTTVHCHPLTQPRAQIALGPPSTRVPSSSVTMPSVHQSTKCDTHPQTTRCDTPGTWARQIPDLLSDISLTETSRISSEIVGPRFRRYANMLCVLGMLTKQSPTGVTTPRPSTGRQAQHGSSAYKSSVSHAHIITKSA